MTTLCLVDRRRKATMDTMMCPTTDAMATTTAKRQWCAAIRVEMAMAIPRRQRQRRQSSRKAPLVWQPTDQTTTATADSKQRARREPTLVGSLKTVRTSAATADRRQSRYRKAKDDDNDGEMSIRLLCTHRCLHGVEAA